VQFAVIDLGRPTPYTEPANVTSDVSDGNTIRRDRVEETKIPFVATANETHLWSAGFLKRAVRGGRM
jgi:hypothetical protein